jgi:hypothetical protein
MCSLDQHEQSNACCPDSVKTDKVFRSAADKFKIVASYSIGGLATIFCLYAAVADGSRPYIQLLLCILGGATGWCIGLYLTPTDDGEKKQLSEAAKLFLTLLSGIGIAKFDKLQEVIAEWAPAAEPESPLRILLFLCTMVLGALFTYISRLFVKGSEEAIRVQRAKALADLQKNLAKLESLN